MFSYIKYIWLRLFNSDYRTFGAVRSAKWPEVRDAWIKLNPLCCVCGTKKKCEVHHVQPFHLHPQLELDNTNFITLCRPHHYEWGHFFNWSSFNKDVRKDTASFRERVLNRPK